VLSALTPLLALFPLVGVGLGAALALCIPSISRKRNARRAEEAGALWVGLANVEGLDPEQAFVVKEALADVGSLYPWPCRCPWRPSGGG
jgi:hypothetical protein